MNTTCGHPEYYAHGLCQSCYARKHRLEHLEAYRAASRKWWLRVHYGMGQEMYDALASHQGGACAICGLVPNGLLVVDHDHETGGVRGLLCHKCNAGIGLMHDDPAIVGAALAYLAKGQRA